MSQESSAAAQALVAVLTKVVSTELHLKGKAPLKRNLDLRESGYGHLCATIFLLPRFQMIAYCNEKIADCYLHTNEDGRANLWLNHAAFNVSVAEARAIREKFEPLGLRIEDGVAPAKMAL